MGIYSLANSSINNWTKYSNAAVANGQTSDFELITTQILTSAQGSLTFSNLQNYSQYKHLQIRMVTRSVDSQNITLTMSIILNGDLGTNYSKHAIRGNGSSVFSVASTSTTPVEIANIAGGATTAASFGTSILEILDFQSTTKNKTIRSFTGSASGTSMEVGLWSGAWASTAAVSSMTFSNYGANFATGSRFSLYGVK